MKFWKWLARICTALFIAVLLVAWFAKGQYGSTDTSLPNEPPPAPVFR